jgi:hypothetical protein
MSQSRLHKQRGHVRMVSYTLLYKEVISKSIVLLYGFVIIFLSFILWWYHHSGTNAPFFAASRVEEVPHPNLLVTTWYYILT